MLGTILAALPVLGLLVAYKPYRVQRILTFLNPWADPQGSGFQIIQSLIAIGSGGLFGVGIGNSKQKFFYLPMQHTDFIFSIIAEEIGFVGVCIIMSLFFAFFYTGLQLAISLQDPFSRYTVFGFTLLITIQTVMNSAVATGIAPTKGVGLPFISYGSTALTCTITMLGLITAMARAKNKDRKNYFHAGVLDE
jgi:cell division protein FtsW